MGRLSPFSNSNMLGLAIFILTFLMPNHAAPVQETAASRYANEKGCYFMNKHYHTGHEIETNDPCMNCTCTGAAMMCYLRICPFIKPLGENCKMEKHVGDCCPKYWCPEVYPRVPTPRPDSETKGCYLSGLYYEEGSRLPMDPLNPCHACYCIRNVSVCTNETCELHIPGCYPRYKMGSCCPASYACTDEAATTIPPTLLEAETPPGCEINGMTYEDGVEVPSNQTCKKCYCMKHQVMCTEIECTAPGTNCVPHETLEGECCPEKYDCPEDTEIPDSATTHMISTEEEFLKLTTVHATPSTTSPTSASTEKELVSEEAFTTLESEHAFPTTKGIRRIDDETIFTTMATSEPVELSTRITTIEPISVTGPREPKITEVPEDALKTTHSPTGKPSFHPSRPIPGEGICRHENKTYQNGEKITSNDPCREDCMCINSVAKCRAVECVLVPPASGENCKVKIKPGECCPIYVCDIPSSTPLSDETEISEQQEILDVFTKKESENITATEVPPTDVSKEEITTVRAKTESTFEAFNKTTTVFDDVTSKVETLSTSADEIPVTSIIFDKTSESTVKQDSDSTIDLASVIKETEIATTDFTEESKRTKITPDDYSTAISKTKTTDKESAATQVTTEREVTKVSQEFEFETTSEISLEAETVFTMLTPEQEEKEKTTEEDERISETDVTEQPKDISTSLQADTDKTKITSEDYRTSTTGETITTMERENITKHIQTDQSDSTIIHKTTEPITVVTLEVESASTDVTQEDVKTTEQIKTSISPTEEKEITVKTTQKSDVTTQLTTKTTLSDIVTEKTEEKEITKEHTEPMENATLDTEIESTSVGLITEKDQEIELTVTPKDSLLTTMTSPDMDVFSKPLTTKVEEKGKTSFTPVPASFTQDDIMTTITAQAEIVSKKTVELTTEEKEPGSVTLYDDVKTTPEEIDLDVAYTSSKTDEQFTTNISSSFIPDISTKLTVETSTIFEKTETSEVQSKETETKAELHTSPLDEKLKTTGKDKDEVTTALIIETTTVAEIKPVTEKKPIEEITFEIETSASDDIRESSSEFTTEGYKTTTKEDIVSNRTTVIEEEEKDIFTTETSLKDEKITTRSEFHVTKEVAGTTAEHEIITTQEPRKNISEPEALIIEKAKEPQEITLITSVKETETTTAQSVADAISEKEIVTLEKGIITLKDEENILTTTEIAIKEKDKKVTEQEIGPVTSIESETIKTQEQPIMTTFISDVETFDAETKVPPIISPEKKSTESFDETSISEYTTIRKATATLQSETKAPVSMSEDTLEVQTTIGITEDTKITKTSPTEAIKKSDILTTPLIPEVIKSTITTIESDVKDTMPTDTTTAPIVDKTTTLATEAASQPISITSKIPQEITEEITDFYDMEKLTFEPEKVDKLPTDVKWIMSEHSTVTSTALPKFTMDSVFKTTEIKTESLETEITKEIFKTTPDSSTMTSEELKETKEQAKTSEIPEGISTIDIFDELTTEIQDLLTTKKPVEEIRPSTIKETSKDMKDDETTTQDVTMESIVSDNVTTKEIKADVPIMTDSFDKITTELSSPSVSTLMPTTKEIIVSVSEESETANKTTELETTPILITDSSSIDDKITTQSIVTELTETKGTSIQEAEADAEVTETISIKPDRDELPKTTIKFDVTKEAPSMPLEKETEFVPLFEEKTSVTTESSAATTLFTDSLETSSLKYVTDNYTKTEIETTLKSESGVPQSLESTPYTDTPKPLTEDFETTEQEISSTDISEDKTTKFSVPSSTVTKLTSPDVSPLISSTSATEKVTGDILSTSKIIEHATEMITTFIYSEEKTTLETQDAETTKGFATESSIKLEGESTKTTVGFETTEKSDIVSGKIIPTASEVEEPLSTFTDGTTMSTSIKIDFESVSQESSTTAKHMEEIEKTVPHEIKKEETKPKTDHSTTSGTTPVKPFKDETTTILEKETLSSVETDIPITVLVVETTSKVDISKFPLSAEEETSSTSSMLTAETESSADILTSDKVQTGTEESSAETTTSKISTLQKVTTVESELPSKTTKFSISIDLDRDTTASEKFDHTLTTLQTEIVTDNLFTPIKHVPDSLVRENTTVLLLETEVPTVILPTEITKISKNITEKDEFPSQEAETTTIISIPSVDEIITRTTPVEEKATSETITFGTKEFDLVASNETTSTEAIITERISTTFEDALTVTLKTILPQDGESKTEIVTPQFFAEKDSTTLTKKEMTVSVTDAEKLVTPTATASELKTDQTGFITTLKSTTEPKTEFDKKHVTVIDTETTPERITVMDTEITPEQITTKDSVDAQRFTQTAGFTITGKPESKETSSILIDEADAEEIKETSKSILTTETSKITISDEKISETLTPENLTLQTLHTELTKFVTDELDFRSKRNETTVITTPVQDKLTTVSSGTETTTYKSLETETVLTTMEKDISKSKATESDDSLVTITMVSDSTGKIDEVHLPELTSAAPMDEVKTESKLETAVTTEYRIHETTESLPNITSSKDEDILSKETVNDTSLPEEKSSTLHITKEISSTPEFLTTEKPATVLLTTKAAIALKTTEGLTEKVSESTFETESLPRTTPSKESEIIKESTLLPHSIELTTFDERKVTKVMTEIPEKEKIKPITSPLSSTSQTPDTNETTFITQSHTETDVTRITMDKTVTFETPKIAEADRTTEERLEAEISTTPEKEFFTTHLEAEITETPSVSGLTIFSFTGTGEGATALLNTTERENTTDKLEPTTTSAITSSLVGETETLFSTAKTSTTSGGVEETASSIELTTMVPEEDIKPTISDEAETASTLKSSIHELDTQYTLETLKTTKTEPSVKTSKTTDASHIEDTTHFSGKESITTQRTIEMKTTMPEDKEKPTEFKKEFTTHHTLQELTTQTSFSEKTTFLDTSTHQTTEIKQLIMEPTKMDQTTTVDITKFETEMSVPVEEDKTSVSTEFVTKFDEEKPTKIFITEEETSAVPFKDVTTRFPQTIEEVTQDSETTTAKIIKIDETKPLTSTQKPELDIILSTTITSELQTEILDKITLEEHAAPDTSLPTDETYEQTDITVSSPKFLVKDDSTTSISTSIEKILTSTVETPEEASSLTSGSKVSETVIVTDVTESLKDEVSKIKHEPESTEEITKEITSSSVKELGVTKESDIFETTTIRQTSTFSSSDMDEFVTRPITTESETTLPSDKPITFKTDQKDTVSLDLEEKTKAATTHSTFAFDNATKAFGTDDIFTEFISESTKSDTDKASMTDEVSQNITMVTSSVLRDDNITFESTSTIATDFTVSDIFDEDLENVSKKISPLTEEPERTSTRLQSELSTELFTSTSLPTIKDKKTSPPLITQLHTLTTVTDTFTTKPLLDPGTSEKFSEGSTKQILATSELEASEFTELGVKEASTIPQEKSTSFPTTQEREFTDIPKTTLSLEAEADTLTSIKSEITSQKEEKPEEKTTASIASAETKITESVTAEETKTTKTKGSLNDTMTTAAVSHDIHKTSISSDSEPYFTTDGLSFSSMTTKEDTTQSLPSVTVTEDKELLITGQSTGHVTVSFLPDVTSSVSENVTTILPEIETLSADIAEINETFITDTKETPKDLEVDVTYTETTIKAEEVKPTTRNDTLEEIIYKTTPSLIKEITVSEIQTKEVSEKESLGTTTTVFVPAVTTEKFDVSTDVPVEVPETTETIINETSKTIPLKPDLKTELKVTATPEETKETHFTPESIAMKTTLLPEISTFESERLSSKLDDITFSTTEVYIQNRTETETSEITHDLITTMKLVSETEELPEVSDKPKSHVSLETITFGPETKHPSEITDTKIEEKETTHPQTPKAETLKTTTRAMDLESTEKEEKFVTETFSLEAEAITKLTDLQTTELEIKSKTIDLKTSTVKPFSPEKDSTKERITETEIFTSEAVTTTEHSLITEETISSNATFAADALIKTQATLTDVATSTDVSKISKADDFASTTTFDQPSSIIYSSTIIGETDITKDIIPVTLESETTTEEKTSKSDSEIIKQQTKLITEISTAISAETKSPTTEMLTTRGVEISEVTSFPSISVEESTTQYESVSSTKLDAKSTQLQQSEPTTVFPTDLASTVEERVHATATDELKETTLSTQDKVLVTKESEKEVTKPIEEISTSATEIVSTVKEKIHAVTTDELKETILSTQDKVSVTDEPIKEITEPIEETSTSGERSTLFITESKSQSTTLSPTEFVSTSKEKVHEITTDELKETILSTRDKVFVTEESVKDITKPKEETSTASEIYTSTVITSELQTDTSFTKPEMQEEKIVHSLTNVGSINASSESVATLEAETSTYEEMLFTTITSKEAETSIPEDISSLEEHTTEKAIISKEVTDISKSDTSTSTVKPTEETTTSFETLADIKPTEISDTHPDVELPEGLFGRPDEITDKTTTEKRTELPTEILDTTIMISETMKTSLKPGKEMDVIEKTTATFIPAELLRTTKSTVTRYDTEATKSPATITGETSTILPGITTQKAVEITTEKSTIIEEVSKTTESVKFTDITEEKLKPVTQFEDGIIKDVETEKPVDFIGKDMEASTVKPKPLPELSTTSVSDISSPEVDTTTAVFISSDTTEMKETKIDMSPTLETHEMEISTTITKASPEASESTSSTATTVSPEMPTKEATTVTSEQDIVSEKETLHEIQTTPSIISQDIPAETFDEEKEKNECIVNGTIYKDGEAITTVDPCEKCHCSLGEINCFKILCKLPKEGCIVKPNSTYECCPTSYECPETSDATERPHAITHQDITTPIPISFMFSTLPTSIASTVLITKPEDVKESDREKTKAPTEVDFSTIRDESVTSTVTDMHVSTKVSEMTASHEVRTESTLQAETEVTERTKVDIESSSRIPMSETDVPEGESRTPSIAMETAHDLSSTYEEPKEILDSETTATGLTPEKGKPLITTAKPTLHIELTSTTLTKEDETDATKQPTETPTTFDTTRTTFAETHTEKEEEISAVTESTTVTLRKLDEEVTKPSHLTTVSDIPTTFESTTRGEEVILSNITTDFRSTVAERPAELTTIERKATTMAQITEEPLKQSTQQETVSFDAEPSTGMSEIFKEEKEKTSTRQTSDVNITEQIRTSEGTTVEEGITDLLSTSIPSKLPKFDDILTSTTTEEKFKTTADTSKIKGSVTTEVAFTETSATTFRTAVAIDGLKDINITVTAQEMLSTTTMPSIIKDSTSKDKIPITLHEDEALSTESFDETTEGIKLLTTLRSLSTPELVSLDTLATTDSSFAPQTKKSMLTTTMTSEKEVITSETPRNESVRDWTDKGTHEKDLEEKGLDWDKFTSTTSVVQDITTDVLERATDFKIVTEIVETNKSITSLDREGTLMTTEMETKLPSVSTLTTLIAGETPIGTTKSEEIKIPETSPPTPTITDKIFTFVSTRFTDKIKGITELTTLKAEDETVDTSEMRSTSESPLDISTEKSEKITPFIPLTQKVDLDMDKTTTEKFIAEEAETTVSFKTEDDRLSTESIIKSEEEEKVSTIHVKTDDATKMTTSEAKETPEEQFTSISSLSPVSEAEKVFTFVTKTTTAVDRESTDVTGEVLKDFTKTLGTEDIDKTIITESITEIDEGRSKTSEAPKITTSSQENKTVPFAEEFTRTTSVTTMLPKAPLESASEISLLEGETSTSRTIKEIRTEPTTSEEALSSTHKEPIISETTTVKPVTKTEIDKESDLVKSHTKTESTAVTATTEQGKEMTFSEVEVPSRVTRKDIEFEITLTSLGKTEIHTEKPTTIKSLVGDNITIHDVAPITTHPPFVNVTPLFEKSTSIESITEKELEILTTLSGNITIKPATESLLQANETIFVTHTEKEKEAPTSAFTKATHETKSTLFDSFTTEKTTAEFSVDEKSVTELPVIKTTFSGTIYSVTDEVKITQEPKEFDKTTFIVADAETATVSATSNDSSISTQEDFRKSSPIESTLLPKVTTRIDEKVTTTSLKTTKTTTEPEATAIAQDSETTTVSATSNDSSISTQEDFRKSSPIESTLLPKVTTRIDEKVTTTSLKTTKTTTEPEATAIAQDSETTTVSATSNDSSISTQEDFRKSSPIESTLLPKVTTRIDEKVTTTSLKTTKTTTEPEATTIAQDSETTASTFTEKTTELEAADRLSPETSTRKDETNVTEYVTKGYKAIETTTMKEEEDYIIDDNTCIFEGRIYQSAEQIPRADPCEFCFCFRGDIICLQQSCPPPAPNCEQTTIPGYCCPRYECPVYVTSKNLTAITRRKGVNPIIIQKRIDKREIRPTFEVKGCQINGTFFELGKTVTSASGPCLHCVCQEDGFMHCDPQRCKPQAPLMLKMNNSFFRRR